MPLPLAGLFAGGFFAKVLAFVLAGVFVRIITALGITIIAFQGIDLLTTELENFVNSSIALLDSYIVSMLTISGFMFTIQLLLSTIVGVLSIKALTSAKRMVFK